MYVTINDFKHIPYWQENGTGNNECTDYAADFFFKIKF